MVEKMININSIQNVKDFNMTVIKFDVSFDLVSDRYVIDAKSIMGIFSLDLSKDIKLIIHTEDKELLERIESELKKFYV